MLVFYFAPNTCSLASHIALHDAAADFEPRRVDFKSAEQRGESYLGINPKGRVPALVTPRGILTETPALLGFIAQTHPAARLAPTGDPFAFAELQAFNAYLCSTVHVAHAHRVRGSRWASEESSFGDMRRKVAQNMTDCFDLIETRNFRGPWVMGESYTTADPYLFTLSCWLEGDGVDIVRFPRIADHFERMKTRDSVRRAFAELD